MNVIEDDAATRRALCRLMRSAGFEALSFCCIDEFLDAGPPSADACVVTDVHMPGLSALDLPTRLRELNVKIPVIFLTADYSNATLEKIRTAGGQGYFKKPVDDQALIDTIRWATVGI